MQIPIRPEAPILDSSVLQEFLDVIGPGGPTLLRGITAAFQEETPPLLDALAVAVDENDFTSATMLAHRLRGSSISLGAQALAASCAALETGEPQYAAGWNSIIKTEYYHAVTAIQVFLDRIGA